MSKENLDWVDVGEGDVPVDHHFNDGIFNTLDDKIINLNIISLDLNNKINLMEALEVKMEIINIRIEEIQEEFDFKLKQNKETKQITLANTELTASQISFQLNVIERDTAEIKNMFEQKLVDLNIEKVKNQERHEDLTVELDNDFESLCTNFDSVLTQIKNDPIDLLKNIHIKKLIKDFEDKIDEYRDIKLVGWILPLPKTKLTVLLEDHGLKETKSGHLLTDTGKVLTYNEAYDNGYFKWLDYPLDVYPEKKPFSDESDISSIGSIQDKSSKESSFYSQMSSEDIHYLKEAVGTPLTLAIAEIATKQPRDPIHYLGHFLFKYRYNEEISKIQQKELDQLNAERDLLAKEKWQKFILKEAQNALWEIIRRAEHEIYMRELKRIEMEMTRMAEEEEGERGIERERGMEDEIEMAGAGMGGEAAMGGY